MNPKEFVMAFCFWKWWVWTAGAFLCYAMSVFAGNEIQTELSLRIASTLCGLQEVYYTDNVFFKETITDVPMDIVSVAGCERILWTKCPSQDGSCTPRMEISSTACGTKSSNSRIINGVVAQQEWNKTKNVDAPWDINLRYINAWGGSQADFRDWEVENNNVSSLGESHRCSGTAISNNAFVTAGYCGEKGRTYFGSSRTVIWLARKRYRYMAWVEHKGDRKNADIFTPPKFRASLANPESLDDIAVIRIANFTGSAVSVVKARFPHKVDIYGLEIPEPSVEFETKAMFAGWGTTIANKTGSGNTGKQDAYSNVLHKIDLQIVPVNEGACATAFDVYKSRLRLPNREYDWSKEYMCAIAQPKEGKVSGLCSGDIGGALVCTGKADKKKYFCGVRNSWGIVNTCPSPEKAEIFIKMSFYKAWIEKVTEQKQNVSFLAPGKNYYICRNHCSQNEDRK